MTIQQRANFISGVIVVISLALTAAFYFLFKIFFLFIIFVPPIIYRLLKRKAANDGASFDDSEDA
jgi:hypothetical protein